MEPIARRCAKEWIEGDEACPDHVRMYVQEIEEERDSFKHAVLQLRAELHSLIARMEEDDGEARREISGSGETSGR